MVNYHALSRAGKFGSKLQHVANYPLARRIKELKIPGNKTSKYTAQVVNPALCDDIIGYIEPELAPYKGCDILDLNPGACLWTTKLHEYLKPRVHLLVEPAKSKYLEPFINPLVEEKDSTYRHVALYPDVIKDLYAHNLFGEGLLPPGEQWFSPKNQINRRLLVTGNYAAFPHKHSLEWAKILSNILRLGQEGRCMHAYGVPKMLFWVGNDYKDFFSARTVRDRGRETISVEKGLMPVEVCTAPQNLPVGYGASLREYRLDEESRQRTQARMEAAGIIMPEHRKVEEKEEDIIIPEEVVDEDLMAGNPGDGGSRLNVRESVSNKSVHDLGPVDWSWAELDYSLRKYIRVKEEIQKLEREMGIEGIAADEDAEFKTMKQTGKKVIAKAARLKKRKDKEAEAQKILLKSVGGPAIFHSGMVKSTTSPLHRELREARSQIRFRLRSKVLIGKLVLASEELRNYKVQLRASGIDFTAHDFDDNHPEEYQRFRGMESVINDIKDKVNMQASIAEFHMLEDDRHAMSPEAEQPLLPWDRRPYEPLNVQPEEFYPNHALSLLSFTPHEVAPHQVSEDFQRTYRLMIGILFHGGYNTNIIDAVECIAPGASDYLIPLVPEMREPRMGGMVDLTEMRIRLLTVEMALQLAEAWIESPLRWESGELGALSSNDDPVLLKRKKRIAVS